MPVTAAPALDPPTSTGTRAAVGRPPDKGGALLGAVLAWFRDPSPNLVLAGPPGAGKLEAAILLREAAVEDGWTSAWVDADKGAVPDRAVSADIAVFVGLRPSVDPELRVRLASLVFSRWLAHLPTAVCVTPLPGQSVRAALLCALGDAADLLLDYGLVAESGPAR